MIAGISPAIGCHFAPRCRRLQMRAKRVPEFIIPFLQYRFSSLTKYDIHSPFVYELVAKVIDVSPRATTKANCQPIEHLRNGLLRDKTEINVLVPRAGSSSQKTSPRKIKDICRKTGKNKKYGQLLFRLVNYFQPETILDLGTALGITTLYLSKANPSAKIISIEGCPEIAVVAKRNFEKLSASNIHQVTGNFDDELVPSIKKCVFAETKQASLDFVFFDGNHHKEPTLRYFLQCMEYANNNSVFVFDDIRWSQEMEETWKEIIEHPQVTASIDLFFMGIVFFRKELEKQNFVIRF
ncbi:MAG: O-methyltransferase [Verrucomicrobiia bacterium]